MRINLVRFVLTGNGFGGNCEQKGGRKEGYMIAKHSTTYMRRVASLLV